MKIIEAMKKRKDLTVKMEDLRSKISKHCADRSIETPIYKDQGAQVSSWVQACLGINREIETLGHRIQKTNQATNVSITIGDNTITKSIDQWIYRRDHGATNDLKTVGCLTDRGLKEEVIQSSSPGVPPTEIKRRLYFDPLERDKKIEIFRSEKSIIDGQLEIANAVTDLLD